MPSPISQMQKKARRSLLNRLSEDELRALGRYLGMRVGPNTSVKSLIERILKTPKLTEEDWRQLSNSRHQPVSQEDLLEDPDLQRRVGILQDQMEAMNAGAPNDPDVLSRLQEVLRRAQTGAHTFGERRSAYAAQQRAAEEAARQRANDDAQRKAEEARHEHEGTRHQRDRAETYEAHHAQVLGLTGKMSRKDVRDQYRKLAAEYHPDKVAHLGEKLKRVAESEMKAINAAYGFFRDRYGF